MRGRRIGFGFHKEVQPCYEPDGTVEEKWCLPTGTALYKDSGLSCGGAVKYEPQGSEFETPGACWDDCVAQSEAADGPRTQPGPSQSRSSIPTTPGRY